MADEQSIKLVKFIGQSGYCSRRDAKDLIYSGKITVDNQIIYEPAHLISTTQIVKIDDNIIKPIEESELYLYHKRAGYITTHKDPQERLTIFDDLPHWCYNLKTVGRLDKNTEGLILLTNDGEYARFLELPQNQIERTYQVKTFGDIYEDELQSLADGIEIDGIEYRSIKVKILEHSLNNTWLEITLIEGKNREIRNILNFLDLRIKRLIRIKYGPYELGDLAKGEITKINKRL